MQLLGEWQALLFSSNLHLDSDSCLSITAVAYLC